MILFFNRVRRNHIHAEHKEGVSSGTMSTFFSRSRGEPEVTASDIRKAYASRIEKFFRRVEGRDLHVFQRREHSLESLFAWGEKVLAEKSELESELSLRNRACAKAEEERDGLTKSLQETESKLRTISSLNEKMEGQLSESLAEAQQKYDQDMAKAGQEREDSKIQHEQYVTSLTQQHHCTLESLKKDHESLVESLNRDHKETVASLAQKYQGEIENLKQSHGNTVNRLKGQLLVNQSEYKGWPDEKLRMKFKELKDSIDLITAPQRQELIIPKGKGLESKLDPSRFIARAGNDNAHFLLKSLIWSIFYEHFFSLPFGFGVFGPASSENPLLQVFNSWYTVIEGHDTRGKDHVRNSTACIQDLTFHFVVPSAQDLMIFSINKAANEWRSATFQSAVSVITGDESSAMSNNLTANLSASNVEHVANLITVIFVQVISVSNGSLRAETEEEIRHLTFLAREIAVQFGVHPAYLRLVVPARGESVEIGKDYHDCYDGDYYKGEIRKVDLVTTPGLQKIGDGRSDMTSKWTIVPCEIYPDDI